MVGLFSCPWLPHILRKRLTIYDQDAATYEIVSKADRGYIVDECVPGDSRICGAVFLDDGFSRLLPAKIVAATADATAIDKINPRFMDRAFSWWKRLAKFLLTLPDESETFSLPTPLVYPGAQPGHSGAARCVLELTG